MKTLLPINISQIVFVLFVSISFSSLAIAGPDHHGAGAGKGGRFMSFFDTNRDKMVTMDELNEASKTRFEKIDADGNKVVSADEFKEYVVERRQQRRLAGFKMADQDASGLVSRDEYIRFKEQRAEQRFQELDVDADGLVSSDEFLASRYQRHGGQSDSRSDRHGRGMRFFSKLDGNGDGHVTRDESVIAWSNWFKRIDGDRNQIVTEQEVIKFRDRRRH